VREMRPQRPGADGADDTDGAPGFLHAPAPHLSARLPATAVRSWGCARGVAVGMLGSARSDRPDPLADG
jgi:hypothetical protein